MINKVFLTYGGEDKTPARIEFGDLWLYLPRKLTWFERRFGVRVPYQELLDEPNTGDRG
jgi:hypothetical protein